MPYFALLDILRFFAAFGVMTYHYFHNSTDSMTGILPFLASHGNLGVQLFFMISGFVIHFSLTRSTREFYITRFLRIYPLFWVICSAVYILTIYFTPDPVSFITYLKGLLIVNDGSPAHMVDYVYWSLIIEVLFYIYIGLFVAVFKKERIELFYWIWLLAAFVGFWFDLDRLYIARLALLRSAPYFIFGGALGLLIQNKDSVSIATSIRRILLAVLAIASIFFISDSLHNHKFLTNFFGLYTPTELAVVTLMFIIVSLAIVFNDRIKNKYIITTCKTLGMMTYPLYLIHWKSGMMMINGTSTFGTISIYALLTMIFMIIASYIIGTIEEPLRKKASRFLLRRKDAQIP